MSKIKSNGVYEQSWPDLEPALISLIGNALSSSEQGNMRLICKAWHRAVSEGLQSLTVTRKIVQEQLKDLPKVFPRLQKLDLSDYAWLTDAELEGLKELSMLKEFRLVFGHELSPVGVQYLGKLKNLQVLSLINFGRLDDMTICSLAPLTQLKSLKIQGSPRLTDSGIEVLSGMHKLEDLTLSYMDLITDDSLRIIAKLPKIHTLNLAGNRSLNGNNLRALKELKNLIRLDLSYTSISDATILQLEGLTGLQYLSIAGTQITYEGLTHVAKLHLRKVDISKCKNIPHTACSAKVLPF